MANTTPTPVAQQTQPPQPVAVPQEQDSGSNKKLFIALAVLFVLLTGLMAYASFVNNNAIQPTPTPAATSQNITPSPSITPTVSEEEEVESIDTGDASIDSDLLEIDTDVQGL